MIKYELINLIFIANIIYFMICATITETVDSEIDEDHQYERANEVDLRNASTLLCLDLFIYNVLVDPTKGTGKELLDKFEILTHCMRKAATMFVDENKEKDYDIRAGALVFFNSGGPTFSRIPLYEEENTLPLKRQYNWTDEDIKKLKELQEVGEKAWKKLRKLIL